MTVSDVGKITAKVVAAAGTYSFTATGWDGANEGVHSAKMTTKKGDDANGWVLSFADNAKSAAMTVTLNADGKTANAETLYGAPVSVGKKITTPSYKVSASGYADMSGIGTGAIFADFAPVVTVGKTKKVLSLRANLWFDKKNDHEQGVGSAVFVP